MPRLDRTARHCAFLVLMIGSLAAGCSQSSDETVPLATISSDTPTDDECQQFAKSLEEAVRTGDMDFFKSAIDWDAMLDRATAGIEAPEKQRRIFINAAKEGITESTNPLMQGLRQAGASGRYHFLRVQTVGSEKQVLFRFLTQQGGVNYHRLVLGRMADHKVRAVDIYNFTTGDLFSQTMRRSYLSVAAEASKSLLAKLAQPESDLVKSLGKLEKIAAASAARQNTQVLEIYAMLPLSLQKEKMFLLMRMRAAVAVGEKEYAEALDAFRDYCPGDPCLDLLMIDQYFFKKQYDRALVSIDTLEKAVGGDPYLNVLRAKMYLIKKDFAKARDFAQKALAAEDTLEPAYWASIRACLGAKDFAETSLLLTAMQKKCGVRIGDLATIPEYAEYVKSPQYKEWLEQQERE
jgi:tetratricopeptide (TPR) repeat protein